MRNRSLTCLFGIAVFAVLVFHFGKFIDQAAPALTDDHDIISALGQNATASLHDVWIDLKNTVDYQDLLTKGAATRFRPAFYPLKSLQTYLWGDNIRLWYIATFMMYLATTTVLFGLVLRTFNIWAALVFATFYLGHKAWADIMPRLGPIEIECLLVGTILIYLMWQWICGKSKYGLIYSVPVALFFAALKEPNSAYMIAIAGLLMLSGLLVRSRPMMLAAAVLLLSGVGVFAILLATTSDAANSGLVSPAGPLRSYWMNAHNDQTRWLVAILITLLSTAAIGRYLEFLKISWGELVALFVATLSIEAMRLSVFYVTYATSTNGALDPIVMRYGYPLLVMQPLVAAVVFGRLSALASPIFVRGARATALSCVCLMLFLNGGVLARQTIISRDQWFAFNSEAEAAIRQAADLSLQAKKEGKNPILFVSGPELGWEPELSLILFLRRKLPDAIIYFDADEPSLHREAYTRVSVEFGGTPLSGEMKATTLTPGCIELHVDIKPYSDERCKVLSIVKRN